MAQRPAPAFDQSNNPPTKRVPASEYARKALTALLDSETILPGRLPTGGLKPADDILAQLSAFMPGATGRFTRDLTITPLPEGAR